MLALKVLPSKCIRGRPVDSQGFRTLQMSSFIGLIHFVLCLDSLCLSHDCLEVHSWNLTY